MRVRFLGDPLLGRLKIELPETIVELAAGELFLVPRGIQHEPSADEECHVLVIEPRGVVNTAHPSRKRAHN